MIVLNTASLGEIEISEEQLIAFNEGIPGFEEDRRFVILPVDPELPFAYLQSADDERIHFVVVDPFSMYKPYEFHIDEETQTELGIESEKDVEVWCVVTIQQSLEKATVNLLAPIIINSNHRTGKQMVLHQSQYHTRHLISDLVHQTEKEKG
ncbi:MULTISPECIES: flagellar assembly protein FliW [unclassified Paenibacillus]|uniref:flagellar assembly protein FliW n=1 Tax=unclassified Paenibacillus TaxID=185978 RepID=UPI001AE5E68F|nr:MULTISPECIES: flagellar assembly protein FliW [unclassified Paenibacillus]MBP1157803.1 flagellar assembly factor FliW [Paenibacillus sp. PvP091]MBP1171461.1 flagellar assembly factor FliW [Paenibacillus sp. PvR098]MBP2442489.1 flagellar assembly factor FliW [Paenibacillus sp. PvP052]